MSLQSIDKLALRIYRGTKSSGLIEHPLVAVGTVPATFQPQLPSLVNESEVWMLIHAQDYTLYSYFTIKGDATDSIALINLFIPAGMRLSTDNSPYDLLSKSFEDFKKQSNIGCIDRTPFEQLLTECVLEERPKDMPLPVMTGKNPASFRADSKAQASALLRFSQYPQLSHISHLEIGYQCDTTIAIPIKGKQPIHHRANDTIEVARNRTNRKSFPLKRYLFPSIIIGVMLIGLLYGAMLPKKHTQEVTPISTDGQIVKEMPASQPEKGVKNNIAADSITEDTRTKDKAREEILTMVNKKDLHGCKNHVGWTKYLTMRERQTIEFILNMDKRKGSLQRKIEHELNREFPFRSWDELIIAEHKVAKMRMMIEKEKQEEQAKKEQLTEQAKKKLPAPQVIPANKDNAWQADIRKKANSCPIALRLGVRITSITYTATSVTYIVTYEELSKYDISKEELEHITSDRSNVISTYRKGLPEEISINVIQKDRAGRTL